ncbi:NmrA-like family protein [Annulohypoxylon maeteangense]|uniref:NmrA-like family protein n=1 Tax=Annulohypoxylon maeteangense TaxID=1927788 RepID=UPI0020083839|nr:NmrA-like family protein [Annulohypoxylon maeteangense]KAI0888387.1 NmrA-like family protein [Annulohypoxylon maeteangense]
MAALKKVLVIGASTSGMANLGASLVEELKADGTFEITVLSRKSSPTATKGVNLVKVDDSFPQGDLEKVFTGQDAVVMTTSFQLFGQEDKFIDAAVKAGVKRFISSDFTSNTTNMDTLAMFPMMGGKARVNGELKAKESTGLTWTAISTGIFLDIGLMTGFVGYDLKGHTATIWDDGNAKFSVSTKANVAKAITRVLRNPEITANQHVFVSSLETSMNEILSGLEKGQGVKYDISYTKLEDEVAFGKSMLAKGDFMKAHKLVLAASLIPGYGNNFAEEEKLWNDVLGVPRESIDEVVGKVIRG